jgi:head-tail adaptor
MALGNKQSGFILPLVLFVSIMMMIGVAFLSMNSKVSAKNTINLKRKMSSDIHAQTALNQGLAILNKRISFLNDRITNGIADNSVPGGFRFITNDDVDRYVNTDPAAFWIEWMNDIANEPNFAKDGNNVFFEVDTSSYHLKIEVLSAVNALDAQAENTSGFNNVTLRYGFQITATEKLSGRNHSESIVSSLRPEHKGDLIQVHLVRELSRYNLFAINNTTEGGNPLYDRTSYTGRVYSKNTFYVSGTGVNEPRYDDVIEFSSDASPQYIHKDGVSFQFKKLIRPSSSNRSIFRLLWPWTLRRIYAAE